MVANKRIIFEMWSCLLGI